MAYILTLLVQLAEGITLVPFLVGAVPLGRAYHVVYAVLLGVLFWVAGWAVAQVLKSPQPRMTALIGSIIGALVGVGVTLLPAFVPGAEGAVRLIAEPLYLLAGALIGYWVAR